jgi:SprT protein
MEDNEPILSTETCGTLSFQSNCLLSTDDYCITQLQHRENMPLISPIETSAQQHVIDETLKYLQLASDILCRSFRPINILFDLSGMASGMFLLKHGVPTIRYNPHIFAKYFDYSLANTVPHEVAHYVIYSLYGPKAVRPHGREWKELMLKFGATPSRTNSLNLDGIPTKRQKRYLYRCNCMDHLITSRRHNTIVAGKARYYCRACKAELQPAA